MGKLGNFSTADLAKLQKQLNSLKDEQVQAFVEQCAKELAARLLAKVIKRTPVGVYPKSTGKRGGTLRRGWTSKTQQEAQSGTQSDATAYADSLTITHNGNILEIEIVNPVEYASYVEYGHRTRNHKGWVTGRFMLTMSEQEVEKIAPKVLQAKIQQFLGGIMK